MNIKTNKRVIYVHIDNGEFVTEIKEDNQFFEYARKKVTKTQKTKYLLPLMNIEGYIQGIKQDSKEVTVDGKEITIENIYLTVKNDKEEYVLQVAPFGYGLDLLKRLPGVDFSEECMLRPYSVSNDDGRSNSGIAIYQEREYRDTGEIWNKLIRNYYYDRENKKLINGYPVPTGEEKDKDDWKMYFLQVKKFLKGTIEELDKKIKEANKNVFDTPPEKVAEEAEAPQETTDDLPF